MCMTERKKIKKESGNLKQRLLIITTLFVVVLTTSTTCEGKTLSKDTVSNAKSVEKKVSVLQELIEKRLYDKIFDFLSAIRPQPVTQKEKEILLADFPSSQEKLVEKRLYSMASDALKLHSRLSIIEIIVFNDERPLVLSKAGCAIGLSSKIIELAKENKDALIGVIAHEVAHEYVAWEYYVALSERDYNTLHQCEIFCDLVAVVTLIKLNLNPEAYYGLLKKAANYTIESKLLNNGQNIHPSFKQRYEIYKRLFPLLPK